MFFFSLKNVQNFKTYLHDSMKKSAEWQQLHVQAQKIQMDKTLQSFFTISINSRELTASQDI